MKFPHDDKAQSKAFIKAASEGGRDGEPSTDGVIARLASMPPETHREAKQKQAKKSKGEKPGK